MAVADILEVKLLRWMALAGSFGKQGHVVCGACTVGGGTVNNSRKPWA